MEKNNNSGITAALLAYLIWGILPVYWKMLEVVPAYEILAHRVCWSFVFMGLVIVITGKWQQLKSDCSGLLANKKRCFLLMIVSLLISVNWLTYIWAVNNGHVLDTSIGYYINPLVSVLLGVFMFKESLSKMKWVSVALAAAGIVIMTVQLGTLPWIAIVLPVTFALYGAAKKKLQLSPFSSIFLETLLILPVALAYISLLVGDGANHFTADAADISGLLAGTGIVTATPLVLFTVGANKLPLNVLGFMQYISPTMGFLLGIFYFNEPFELDKIFAFGFIWLALAVFTVADQVLEKRK